MRTGRPKAEEPRAYKISARLTANELEAFEAYARKHNLTNAQVIKNGIKMQLEMDELNHDENNN